ncbi:hypothetical protein GSS88_09810 [Corynebacterium sp. 3HC-13]|uniref:hypothetical protein n=1 Tax=Corynebacterium poyangense TaxID=2684405 RepID=UPI001CCD8926|nr:hypothetical protein [Corynebacterium poyangense]MBZ8178080.1 hypothetical protein [Corynebacterium poyangense]
MSPAANPTPFADLSDSLLGWASHTELELSQQLAHPDLDWFIDTDLGSDELERIDRLFGTFLGRQLAAGADIDALLEVTPSLLVSTAVSRAARLIDPDQFWQEYFVGLGIQPQPQWEAALERHALPAFKKCGLVVPDFDPAPSGAFIALLHAGMTAAEVPAILETLDSIDPKIQVKSTEVTEALGSALSADTSPITHRIFHECGAHLHQLLPGVQELRRFSVAHPSSWLDRDYSHLQPQLPQLVRELVVAELRERPVGTTDRASAVGVALRELRPRLVLDTARHKICLRLPEQRVAPGGNGRAEVSWRVSIEGTTRIFRTGRAWGEPTYAEALDISVDHPVREVAVLDATNNISWAVPVLNADDPVLIFAANGQNLSAKASLHHQELYVVAPVEATMMDVVSGQELPELERFDIPAWENWSCRLIDASHAASIQILRPGHTPSAMHEVRCVDPRQRARFRHPSAPIECLRTSGGLKVHRDSVIAEFPPTLSGTDEIWYLSISAYAGVGVAGEEIADPEPLEVPVEGGEFPIFDPEAYDAPWVGEYLIRLRGPRNESFRHRYGIVEGIRTRIEIGGGSTTVRIPTGGGLSESTLTLWHGEKPFDVEPGQTITVGASEAGADVVISTDEGDRLPLRFTPPRLHFEVPLLAYPPMWRTTRLECQSRSFDPAGEIRVRGIGTMDKPRIAVRNHHGSPLRTVSMNSDDGGRTWIASMKDIAASAALLPSGTLDCEWTDTNINRHISVCLAGISSTPHATAASIDNGELVLSELAPERRLDAWVWPETAPWSPAFSIAVEGERTALPPELVDAGPLRVQLHTRDPFMNLWSPQAPGLGTLGASQEGYFTAQDDALSELSAFLAGERDSAPDNDEVLPILWDHLGAASSSSRPAIQTALESRPFASIGALSGSLVPAENQPGQIINSGLVAVNFESESDHTEDIPAAFHSTPWLRALAELSRLPKLWRQVDQALAEGDVDAATVGRRALKAQLDVLAETAGKNLVSTLSTGRDATLDSACIDQSTVRIAQMDVSQQEALLGMFFANVEVIPGAIMEEGNRLMAVFEAFRHREQLRSLMTSEGLIKPAVKLLRTMRGTQRNLYAAARVRFDKLDGVNTEDPNHAWALAPVVSMVFALSARMHAHGLMTKSRTLDDAARGWAQLAHVVPDLVTGDIVSADAMVMAISQASLRD